MFTDGTASATDAGAPPRGDNPLARRPTGRRFADRFPDLHHPYLVFLPPAAQADLRLLCANTAAAVETRVRDEALERVVARSKQLSPDSVPAFAALRDFLLAPTAEELIGAVEGPPPGNLDHVLATVARHSPVLLWPHVSPMAGAVRGWIEEASGSEFLPCSWVLVSDPSADGRLGRPGRDATPVARMERFLHDYGVVALRRGDVPDGTDPTAKLRGLLARWYDAKSQSFVIPDPSGGRAREFALDVPEWVQAADFGITPSEVVAQPFDTVLLPPCPDAQALLGRVATYAPMHLTAKHVIFPTGTEVVVHHRNVRLRMYNPARFLDVAVSLDFSLCDPDLRIPDSAFFECGATRIDLSPLHSLDTIGSAAFSRLALEALLLPQDAGHHNRRADGLSVFESTRALEGLGPAPWLREMPSHTFNSSNFTSIDLSGMHSMRVIGKAVFAHCSSLTTVVAWPPRLEHIGPRAFEHTGLRHLSFESVWARDDAAFIIDEHAFAGCTALETCVLPAHLTAIRASAFALCDAVKSFDVSRCHRLATIAPKSLPKGVPIDLSNSVITAIPDGAWDASRWKLPKTTRRFGAETLSRVPQGDFTSSGPVTLAPRTFAKLHASQKRVDLTAFGHLPAIPPHCFASVKHLRRVTCAPGLEVIGERAFHECDDFDGESLLFEACKTLTSIESSAFMGTATSNAFLGGKLSTLGAQAFAKSAVREVSFAAVNRAFERVPVGAFMNCSQLTTVDLSRCEALQTLSDRAFESCTALASVVFPPALVSVNVGTFAGCVALESVDFRRCPKLKSLWAGAFDGCAALTVVDASTCDLMAEVQHGAFKGCVALKHVHVHAAVGARIAAVPGTLIPPEALQYPGKPTVATAKANAWAKPLVARK